MQMNAEEIGDAVREMLQIAQATQIACAACNLKRERGWTLPVSFFVRMSVAVSRKIAKDKKYFFKQSLDMTF